MEADSSGLNLLGAEQEGDKKANEGDGDDNDNSVSEGRIEVSKMEEVSLGDSTTSCVYNACSVEVKGGAGADKVGGVEGGRNVYEQGDDGVGNRSNLRNSSSTWSFSKFIRDRLLMCCRIPILDDEDNNAYELETTMNTTSENDGGGMEEENAKVNGDGGAAGTGMADNGLGERPMSPNSSDPESNSSQRPSNVGSIWIIDCNANAKNAEASKRFWIATGSLVVKNSPFSSAIDMLSKPQPSLFQNVKRLHLGNCDLLIEDLCGMLGKLLLVEELKITTSTSVKANSQMFRAHLMKEFQDSREDKDYFNKIGSRFQESMIGHPQRLRALSILMPLTWQCNLIYKAVEAVMNETKLEVLVLQSSLNDMLEFLVCPESKVNFEDESTWEAFLILDCCACLRRSRKSLKELSLSCGNRFPLDHLKITTISGTPIDVIYRWSFYCTAGILNVLEVNIMVPDADTAYNSSDVFPILSMLNLDLPMLPVRAARGDYMQTPLNALVEFLARNNHIQTVAVCGLRPEEGLENWIKQNFVTVSKNMKIGCTYRSTTLANNLATYDDELVSLAFDIDPEDKRKRVSEIIVSNKDEEQLANPTWRFVGVKCLQIINQLPDLTSFSVKRITVKFNNLTKLAIEDHTVRYNDAGRIIRGDGSGDCGEGSSRLAKSLTDSDIQELFKAFPSLEQLRLDCNMTAVTDFGLTGIGDSIWTRLSQRNKLFSFWYLPYLKYLFLRGLGEKVTDKSAVYAFSEDYSLLNLTELHVFAPGITNFGKEKIRNAFADRSGFILEL